MLFFGVLKNLLKWLGINMYSSNDVATYLNLNIQDYNFLMAFTGSLCGFTFLFFAVYLAVLIGSK
jgi:hypothetical protein